MTLKITHKHATTTGTPPTASDIDVGELAINAADAEIYTKDTAGVVQPFKRKFLQSGTGAVARLIESKLQDAVSVKDFGAEADGTTDDTVAIQAAVNSGKSLIFPQGAYKVTSTINAVDLKLTGDDAVIVGFNGSGFSVTNSVCISGHLTFQGFENSTDREGQATNYTTSAIYFPVGAQIQHMRIGRNVKFYRCRHAVRFGSDSSDTATDSTGNLFGPSWFYASAEECVNPVHLHCIYSDLEIAHGTYKNIIGSGRTVAAISCSMDNLIATSPIYEQTSKIFVHHLIIDTVVNRTTTGDSSPGNAYECTGIRIMGQLITVDNIIGKDVTGVNYDCELIYIKGSNFSVTNVLSINCGSQEGAIALKGLDPTDTAGTSVPGGRGLINNVRIFFDNYAYDNDGTNVSLDRTGIAINVPFDVSAGDNITVRGANSSSVVLNGQDAINANFTGSFKVLNPYRHTNGILLRGAFKNAKIKFDVVDPDLTGVNAFTAIRIVEVPNRGSTASYDFSNSSLYINSSETVSGVVSFAWFSYATVNLNVLKMNNVLFDVTAPNAADICAFEFDDGGNAVTGTFNKLIMRDWDFVNALPETEQLLRRGDYQFKEIDLDFSFKTFTTSNTTRYPLTIALDTNTQLAVDWEAVAFNQDTASQARWHRIGEAFYNNAGTATAVPSSSFTLVDVAGGTTGVNALLSPSSSIVRLGINGDTATEYVWSCRAIIKSTNSSFT